MFLEAYFIRDTLFDFSFFYLDNVLHEFSVSLRFSNVFLKPNGVFHVDDVRRFCRVCNVELNAITQYQSHRSGKKHQKRQADYDKTGRFTAEIQMAIAKEETHWQRHLKTRGAAKKSTTVQVYNFSPKKFYRGQYYRGNIMAIRCIWYLIFATVKNIAGIFRHSKHQVRRLRVGEHFT